MTHLPRTSRTGSPKGRRPALDDALIRRIAGRLASGMLTMEDAATEAGIGRRTLFDHLARRADWRALIDRALREGQSVRAGLRLARRRAEAARRREWKAGRRAEERERRERLCAFLAEPSEMDDRGSSLGLRPGADPGW